MLRSPRSTTTANCRVQEGDVGEEWSMRGGLLLDEGDRASHNLSVTVVLGVLVESTG